MKTNTLADGYNIVPTQRTNTEPSIPCDDELKRLQEFLASIKPAVQQSN